MQILDGKLMAAQVEAELKARVDKLREVGHTPGLQVILVGEDPASQLYVGNKEKMCGRLGIYSKTVRMPEETTQEELEHVIRKANGDPAIHGLLVQVPLPSASPFQHSLVKSNPAAPPPTLAMPARSRPKRPSCRG